MTEPGSVTPRPQLALSAVETLRNSVASLITTIEISKSNGPYLRDLPLQSVVRDLTTSATVVKGSLQLLEWHISRRNLSLDGDSKNQPQRVGHSKDYEIYGDQNAKFHQIQSDFQTLQLFVERPADAFRRYNSELATLKAELETSKESYGVLIEAKCREIEEKGRMVSDLQQSQWAEEVAALEAANEKLNSENEESKYHHAAEIASLQEKLENAKSQFGTDIEALEEKFDKINKALAVSGEQADAKCKGSVCDAEKEDLRRQLKDLKLLLTDQCLTSEIELQKFQHVAEIAAMEERLRNSDKALTLLKQQADSECDRPGCLKEKDELRWQAKAADAMKTDELILGDDQKLLDAKLKRRKKKIHGLQQMIQEQKDKIEELETKCTNLEARMNAAIIEKEGAISGKEATDLEITSQRHTIQSLQKEIGRAKKEFDSLKKEKAATEETSAKFEDALAIFTELSSRLKERLSLSKKRSRKIQKAMAILTKGLDDDGEDSDTPEESEMSDGVDAEDNEVSLLQEDAGADNHASPAGLTKVPISRIMLVNESRLPEIPKPPPLSRDVIQVGAKLGYYWVVAHWRRFPTREIDVTGVTKPNKNKKKKTALTKKRKYKA